MPISVIPNHLKYRYHIFLASGQLHTVTKSQVSLVVDFSQQSLISTDHL
jgi:hypothetical protein